ncbi:hypothetical protein ABH920_006876 [Catenulispora sp. EB89]|uniref:hypothetical protein n=1 Tax=Catenulispora sp. EB89 TaxID=3156257 RepID=UPI003515E746
MRFKGRLTAGIAVAALTASVGLLSAGTANAVVWDQGCTKGPQDAKIYGDNVYCYYEIGVGYSNVYNVGKLSAGDYHAVFQTSAGPQDIPAGQTWPEPNIHTGNFTLTYN